MLHTTLRLDPRRALRDVHAIHRGLEAAHDGQCRVLWARPAPDRMVIASPQPPPFGEDGTAYGGLLRGVTSHSIQQAQVHYAAGATVAWALVANPTKAVAPRDPDGRPVGKSRRVPLPEDEVAAWAQRRLAPAMQVPRAVCRRLPPAFGRQQKGSNGITLVRYAVSGDGVVTDPAALADMLTGGVGPGKAFGCGLLLAREVVL